MVERLKMYIDGEWVDAESGKTFKVRSPATGEVLAVLPDADKEEEGKTRVP